jgi:hypothetical protein
MADKNPNNPNEIMVNLKEALKAAKGGWDDPMERYNGGWTKTVVKLDKSRDNGYSLVGDFVKRETTNAYQRIGLYLDCDIGGSRKNQRKYYTLFSIDAEGEATIHAAIEHSADWAIKLWPEIEKYFAVAYLTNDAEDWTAPRPHDQREAEIIRALAQLIKDRNVARALLVVQSACVDAGVDCDQAVAAHRAAMDVRLEDQTD